MTDIAPGGARPIPHHQRVFAAFFFYSVVLGAMYPRLGDIQLAMGVGEAALGAALLGIALGSQISLMFAGPLIERVGHRRTILWCVPAIGLGEIAASLAPGPVGFFLCLFLAGLFVGAIEIVINLEADRAEARLGRRLMSRAHAFWSFGFFAAGLLGAAAAELKLAPWLHLLLVDAVAVGLLLYMLDGFDPAPPRASAHHKAPRFVMPTPGILALVAFVLSAMLLEGAIVDWSVIYMRDSFDVTRFTNGLAFAFGAGAQGLTRYFADRFVDRHGPVAVARTLVATLGLGALIVTLSPDAWLSLAGFVLLGIGAACAFPLAMSAAAQRTDRTAQANVAAFAQISFVLYLIAPPLLGFIAQHFGIRAAYGLGLPLVVLSWFFTTRLAPAESTR